MAPLHVIVIGGGPGGLCLAQGLKKAGVSFAVYERDRTPTSRLQGYRVRISPSGSKALHECLPGHLYAAFVETCGSSSGKMSFLTETMGQLLQLEFPANDPVKSNKSASRITLRQILLSGIEDAAHFGKIFTHYSFRDDGKIVAEFADGSYATGDVLVGADGGSSRVRSQFLPHAQRIDTGVVGIAGKAILTDEIPNRIPKVFLEGAALISAPGGLGMFIAPQIFRGEHTGKTGFGGNGDGGKPSVGPLLDNTKSYVMWALSGRRQVLLPGDPAQTLGGEALKRIAQEATLGWHQDLQELIARTEPATVSCLPIRTSLPVGPWPTQRITLLGDAIHSMTPFRGIGANIALRDAAALSKALWAANRGEKDLLASIHDYEAEMIRYGFRAVRESLRTMERTLDDRTLIRTVHHTTFKMIQALPPVKRWLFRQRGEE
ncbi:MAG TPA: FAD-dependent monooxygenase [Methylocella sp.]|nr:FAD-dependent monooxygenase [Methylocella sp.]